VFENISAPEYTRKSMNVVGRHLIPTSKPSVDIQVVLLGVDGQNSGLEGGITRDAFNILH
jgi:hypothetical protein